MTVLMIILLLIITYLLLCGVIALSISLLFMLFKKDQATQSFGTFYWAILKSILFLGYVK